MKRAQRAIARLYWIDVALQRGGFPNAHQLAQELGVSSGTILRDLARLREEYRAPLTYDPAEHGFAYRRAYRPALPRFSAEETVELARTAHRAGSISGTALERALFGLLDDLVALLPEQSAHEHLDAARAKRRSAPASSPAEERLSPAARSARTRARQRLRGTGGGATPGSAAIPVTLRFDQVAGPEILKAGLLRRGEVQLLTDGGFETTLETRDADALLLELLRWSPNFEISAPAWVRRRRTTLLRRLLHQSEKQTRRKAGRK